ncbi:META domain-containing protein [Helicobacter mustelae]|uniref:Putative secreted protein n=1 Tax=Helicobacter mustelae (strain ATCC 43772 / CCUG 25715 / CIP 103759 / LMG 18044 / NCTC 12198 / R85-136P) TaxID=679897 RepID=D3UHX8_HELM1|nr:META domain-containing protein [Helicobacter mustelae]CBG40101.1 Putative secreted protein [Helicobacter mustelae 12198]SQH71615.1 motility protein [Helicobacter mustelae]STP12740.1 motility protein [Helicobacter mustelae]
MLKFFSLIVVFVLSGCGLLDLFKGSFSGNNWEIEKIVIQGKSYDGLRGMKDHALKLLSTKDEVKDDAQNNQDPLASMDGNQEMSPEDLQELAQKDNVSSLRFDTKQNRIYGDAGCNNFSADYSWKDADDIEIYEINITRRICNPPSLMDFELLFAQNLKGLFFVEKKGKTAMILRNKDVQIYLKSL